MQQNKRRLPIYILTVVMLASSIAMLPIFPSTASAVSKPTDEATCKIYGGTWEATRGGQLGCSIALANAMTPDEMAKSKSYFVSLGNCVEDKMRDKFSTVAGTAGATDPNAGWFTTGDKAYVVYPDGQLSCPDIARKALDFWGWGTDYVNFLSGLGYKFNAGTPGYEGPSDGSKRRINFENSVYQRFYGVSSSGGGGMFDVPMNDAAWYNMYYNGFIGGTCEAKDLGLYSAITDPTWKAWIDSGKTVDSLTYTKIFIANSDGTIAEHGFTYKSSDTISTFEGSTDITRGVQLYGQGDDRKGNYQTCQELSRSVSDTAPGWQAWMEDHPGLTSIQPPTGTASNAAGGDDAAKKQSCNIDGVGWIVCPVMRFMSQIVDQAYGAIAAMLTTPAVKTTTSDDNPMYKAWSYMRNFANIAFVIAFLIIIFSQLTSIGLNNYNIKKMIPRLIVAAILVNSSYWICAIAVDISNILGMSLKDLLDGTSRSLYVQAGAANGGAGGGWDALTVQLLGTAGAVTVLYLGVSVLLPMLIAALAAIVTVVLVLTLRQALIIILIVISPLAFVAYLLPNTEKWFNKWRELFQVLLLMFPIIAVIFGGSALASTIIANVAGSTSTPSLSKFVLQVMAAGITIIPLFIVPVVMKTAGGLLNRFGGIINNPNKGPFDRMRKGATRIREDQEGKRAIRAMNGGPVFGRGRFQRQAKREAVSQGIKSEVGRAKSQFIADEIEGSEGFRNRVAGGSRGAFSPDATPAAMQRALAGAKFTIDNAVAENMKAEAITVRDLQMPALKALLADPNASEERKGAAMQRLVKISDPADYASDVNTAMGGSETLRRATAEALSSYGPGFLKAGDIDRIATGSHESAPGVRSTLQSIAAANVPNGVLSQEKMVDEPQSNLQFAFDHSGLAGQQAMVNTAAALKANPVLNGKIKHNKQSIDNLSVATRP